MSGDALKALAKLNDWDARTTQECPTHGVWRYQVPEPWQISYRGNYDPAQWYSAQECPDCRTPPSYPNIPRWWWYEAS